MSLVLVFYSLRPYGAIWPPLFWHQDLERPRPWQCLLVGSLLSLLIVSKPFYMGPCRSKRAPGHWSMTQHRLMILRSRKLVELAIVRGSWFENGWRILKPHSIRRKQQSCCSHISRYGLNYTEATGNLMSSMLVWSVWFSSLLRKMAVYPNINQKTISADSMDMHMWIRTERED